jgi:site-specific DNA recombinase
MPMLQDQGGHHGALGRHLGDERGAAFRNIHVGLTGTINALFLADLANKTWRGLRGASTRRSGGGLTYGYEVTRKAE